MIRGVDDGPDGLRHVDALDGQRPKLTQHSILLRRAQACTDGASATIVLCDIALGRPVSADDLQGLPPSEASRLGWTNKRAARTELEHAS